NSTGVPSGHSRTVCALCLTGSASSHDLHFLRRDEDVATSRGANPLTLWSIFVIELEGVAKTFDGTILALQDVSFSVATGSICALLGHNGAGKTTTINILSTLMRPTYGKAIVADYDVVREPSQVRACIGMTG